jgi:hypothetical protein
MWSLEVIKEMNKQKPKDPQNEKTPSTEAERVKKLQEQLNEISRVLAEAKEILSQTTES